MEASFPPNFQTISFPSRASKPPDLQNLHLVCRMATCRRPRTNIDAITVFNSYNTEDGSWIPLKISIGSWVLLQTRRRKRKSTNDFIEHFKGQVKGFKVSPGSSCVTEVHIQHSFHHVNLKLKELPLNWPRHRPNCKFNPHAFDFSCFGR